MLQLDAGILGKELLIRLDQPVEAEVGGPECILNNPKVTDPEIIQVLIQEYYEQTYQIANEQQPVPRLARQAACRALAQVVHQRQCYWGEPPLDDWIHSLVQDFLTIQKKNGQGSPVEADIGNAEGFSPLMAIEQDLVDLSRGAHQSSQVRIGLLFVMGLTVVVLLLWLAGINQLISMPGPFNRVRFHYPYITQPGDTLESIAKKAGIEVSDIWANQGETFAKPLTPGMTLWLPSSKPGLWQSLFPRRVASSPAPLTLDSTPAEIQQRILDSPRYWQTLWAERITMNYGPPGYVAPPFFISRQQIWIRQPGQGLLLMGDVRDPLVTISIYFDGNRIYLKDTAVSNSIYTYFLKDSNEPGSLPSPPDIPFLPRISNEEWEVKTVGMETVAGRNTLVVDLYHADGQREARLWVDTSLGVILAERWYGEGYNGTEYQPALGDLIVLTIEFGVKIPEAMLNPNNHLAKFVKDVNGNPLDAPNLARPVALRFGPDPASIAIDHTPPPAGFNANQSRLTLRLVPLPIDDLFNNVDHLGSGTGDQTRMIDVFGDDYYLGTLNLHSTDRVQLDFCIRSPDGSLVLFNVRTADDNIVNWFRLSDPQTVHSLPGGRIRPVFMLFLLPAAS